MLMGFPKFMQLYDSHSKIIMQIFSCTIFVQDIHIVAILHRKPHEVLTKDIFNPCKADTFIWLQHGVTSNSVTGVHPAGFRYRRCFSDVGKTSTGWMSGMWQQPLTMAQHMPLMHRYIAVKRQIFAENRSTVCHLWKNMATMNELKLVNRLITSQSKYKQVLWLYSLYFKFEVYSTIR